MTSIRRRQREELVSKRRQLLPCSSNLHLNSKFTELKDCPLAAEYMEYNLREPRLEELAFLAECLMQNDLQKMLYGAIGLRKLLCLEVAPVQAVIDLGVVIRFVAMLGFEDFAYVQLEAAWALTNIVSGTALQCECVVDKGAISSFIGLLESKYAVLAEQAIWAIANIAGDNTRNRDELISRGVLKQLRNIVEKNDKEYILNRAVWATCNLCRGKPLPKFGIVKESLAMLCQIIRSVEPEGEDYQLLVHCCTAISHHCNASSEYKTFERLNFFADEKVVPRLVSFLTHEPDLLVPSLRTLGNFTTGKDEHTQLLLNENILIYLHMLLASELVAVRKNTCWMLGNIAAGTKEQAEAVAYSSDMVAKLMELLKDDKDSVRKEIVVMAGNLTIGMDKDAAIHWALQVGVIQKLIGVLETAAEADLLEETLQTVDRFLEIGTKAEQDKNKNPIYIELSRSYGIDTLEKLQKHKSNRVFQLVSDMLTNYFVLEEEDY